MSLCAAGVYNGIYRNTRVFMGIQGYTGLYEYLSKYTTIRGT